MEHSSENLALDELILKLEQAKAHLELEIHKKDVQLKEKEHEIKYLKAQIKNKNENGNSIKSKSDKDMYKELEESRRPLNDQLVYKEIIESYEQMSRRKLALLNILQNEYNENKMRLAGTERNFLDLLQKYENAKAVREGFERNATKLQDAVARYEEMLKEQARRFELLQAYSNAGMEKGRAEVLKIKSDFENELTRLAVSRKKLEHAISITKISLEQKTKECSELAALSEEWAGMKKF